MTDAPNTFIDENGVITFVDVYEMTDNDMDAIFEAKHYCNIVESHFKTNDFDEMLRKGMGYRAAKKYIQARHDLVIWGYKPEDWKEWS